MMNTPLLSLEERTTLLRLARQSITLAAARKPLPPLNLDEYTPALREWGASFVTLTEQGELRGCIGALEPYQPLVEDVYEHAAAAAMEDYRFPQVRPTEVPHIQIEISRLTTPMPLEYDSPGNLPGLLRPGVDGVVLRDAFRRATFLPQVWEKIPRPEDFLSHLCLKMGASADTWKHRPLTVLVYQVEEFHE